MTRLLQQFRQHIHGHWNIANAAHVYDPKPLDENRHRWYQCDKLHRMEPTASEDWNVNCFLPMAHPGDCMVRWKDALWWASPNGYEDHAPRLALVIELGGPNDVKLIEEPDFGVIWDHFVPKAETMLTPYEMFYDVGEQHWLKWNEAEQKWAL